MSQNPYQAPAAGLGAVGVNSGSREDLRSVAKYQRGVMTCILGYLICVALQFVLPDNLKLILALAGAAVSILGTVFVFMLAIKIYSTGMGILLGILTLIPCLGLIILLVVNARATKVLRQNGISVGIMGADPATI
jgi:hypothetical protein